MRLGTPELNSRFFNWFVIFFRGFAAEMASRTFKRDEVLAMLSDDDNESVQSDNYSNKSDFESESIV